MRTTKLLAVILTVAAFVSSCKQDEDYVLPSLKVAAETLDFKSGTEQSFGLVSTPDWIAIDPDHGTASAQPQWVTVTALPNDSYDRTGSIVFTIGLSKSEVTVTQPGALGPVSTGSGTLEDPYTVAGAVAYVSALPADTETTSNIYIKGKISSITEEYGAQYGNATFYIQDEGSDVTFYVFRALYLGNAKWTASDKQIAVGDEVVICGLVVNYRGNTPETVINKSFIYSLNGESKGGSGGGGGDAGTPSGSGTQADPYNVAAARDAVKNLTWTSNDDYQKTETVYVKGKISKIADNGAFAQSGTFGNATFFISDDGKTANELEAYRILYLGNQKYSSGTDIKVGDEVVICGKLMNYRGNTPETVANEAYLYSLNGQTSGGGSDEGGSEGGEEGGDQGGTASGSGTQASPYNAAAAAAAVKDLTWTSNTEYQKTDPVYVKGKISKIANKGTFTEAGEYGNATFYISDDGKETGTQFYIFRTLYFGNKKFEAGQTDIKVGDEVVVYGPLMNYQGNTPETEGNKSYLYSLNGKTE